MHISVPGCVHPDLCDSSQNIIPVPGMYAEIIENYPRNVP